MAGIGRRFWTTIPFGTGGRRGKLYPIGTNAINDRTIGESAQGLADYVREVVGKKPLGLRHRLRYAASLARLRRTCAGIMAAAGFKVWFLDGFRSTPEESFAVRYKSCDCGIMITASHNPPTRQRPEGLLVDRRPIAAAARRGRDRPGYRVKEISRMPWAEGLASGRIEYCQEEVDAAFVAAVMRQSRPARGI